MHLPDARCLDITSASAAIHELFESRTPLAQIEPHFWQLTLGFRNWTRMAMALVSNWPFCYFGLLAVPGCHWETWLETPMAKVLSFRPMSI